MDSTRERFLSKVDKGDGSGCWLWTGAISDGYGIFSVGGRLVRAHRFSYELFVGPIPDGDTIDHVRDRGCVSRACVRPDHLEPVSRGENVLRGDGPTAVHARKTHCINGHRFDEANTYVRPTGGRDCRTCKRERERAA